jgi:hypothetical protein
MRHGWQVQAGFAKLLFEQPQLHEMKKAVEPARTAFSE